MARRNSEPVKSLRKLSIQPRRCHTSSGERKKKKIKPKRYTYKAFICFLYEHRDEKDEVSEFFKEYGYNCTDSNGDIAPNKHEFHQIAERMTQSQWIVLMFAKESFMTVEEGRVQYLIGTAVAIAISRNRKCLIPVLRGNVETFVPDELSPYSLVDLNNKYWRATFHRLLQRIPERHLANKECPQKDLEQAMPGHTSLEPPEDDIRRFSMPVEIDKSVQEILKKTRFSQPLKNILATVRHRKRLKMVHSLSVQGSITRRLSTFKFSEETESQRTKQRRTTNPGLKVPSNAKSSKQELIYTRSSLSLITTVQLREERDEKIEIEEQFKEPHFRLPKI